MGDWCDRHTIGLLPERAALQWGAREALAFQGQRWTFAELSARVDAVAKGLIQLGIAPGDKVALWMVNRPEWIDAMFAIMQIGLAQHGQVVHRPRALAEDHGHASD